MNNTFGYIIIDEKKRVLDIWSVEQVIENLPKGQELVYLEDATELNPFAITNKDNIPLYRWNGEKIVKRTEKTVSSDTNPINVPADDIPALVATPGVDPYPDIPPLPDGGD